MSEEIDPSLEALLNEISKAEEDVAAVKNVELNTVEDNNKDNVEENEDNIEAKEVEIQHIDDSMLNSNKQDDEDYEEEQITNVKAEIVNNTDETEQKLKNVVMDLVDKHCSSAEKMFEEAEADRKKIDDVIAVLLPKVESDNYRGSDIGSLAALLQTKADISRNRATMMDSIAKLFAAIKNNDSVSVGKKADESIDQDDVKRLLGG